MFELIMIVIRSLWPFLKESILSGLTPREWMRQNKTTCAWIIIHVTMLIAVSNLVGLAMHQRTELVKTRASLKASIAEHAELQAVHDALHQEHQELKAINITLTGNLNRRTGEIQRLNQILRTCEVVVTPTTFQCPSTPPPAPAPRRPAVQPAIPEERIPLSERLRAIFRRNKD